LKPYILAVSCDACQAAIGKRDNKTSTVALSKRQAIGIAQKKKKAQRKVTAQQKSILKSSADSTLDSEKLDFSPITDTVDPTNSTITESLARLFGFTASSDSFDYSFLKPFLAPSMIRRDMPLGSENSRYQSLFNENTALRNFNDVHHAPVVTQRDPDHSPPSTDLQMDWVHWHACSLGGLPSLNQYFLLILDKGTEYWATYPCKT